MRKDGCSGKVRHPSREAAIICMRKQKNSQLSTYRCGKCGGWHVGNSNKPWKIQARINQLLSRHAHA